MFESGRLEVVVLEGLDAASLAGLVPSLAVVGFVCEIGAQSTSVRIAEQTDRPRKSNRRARPRSADSTVRYKLTSETKEIGCTRPIPGDLD